MQITDGIRYNLRGLWTGLTNARLLFWGIVRFLFVLIITIFAAWLVLIHQQDIMIALWAKPESVWILWLWHIISWLLSLALVGISVIFSYIVSQILFSVFIMDLMSRITEKIVTGQEHEGQAMSIPALFIFLVKQEIPRALAPIVASLILMLIGWFTPLGPIIAILSAGIAIICLSWDNTDLTPARRAIPFKERWRFLKKTLFFHLGFGLPFLIPGLNLLCLAFAPVGATQYYLRKTESKKS